MCYQISASMEKDVREHPVSIMHSEKAKIFAAQKADAEIRASASGTALITVLRRLLAPFGKDDAPAWRDAAVAENNDPQSTLSSCPKPMRFASLPRLIFPR